MNTDPSPQDKRSSASRRVLLITALICIVVAIVIGVIAYNLISVVMHNFGSGVGNFLKGVG